MGGGRWSWGTAVRCCRCGIWRSESGQRPHRSPLTEPFLLCEHACFCPQNGILRGVYPGSPTSWLVVVMTTVGSSCYNVDVSMGLVYYIQRWLPEG